MKSPGGAFAAAGLPTILGARRLRPVNRIAFLSATLEIVETPPSPIGLTFSLALIAAFCIALTWASLGKVDMIASAQSKIVPSGNKILQLFEISVVRAIHVKDGETVKAGDVLIELDPTISDDESRHLRSDLVALQLDVARLRAAPADGDPLRRFESPKGAPEALVATQHQVLLEPDRRAARKGRRASRSTALPWMSTATTSRSHAEWRSPSISRPVRSESSPISCRRCCASSRKACASGDLMPPSPVASDGRNP
jgi:hemolysin D